MRHIGRRAGRVWKGQGDKMLLHGQSDKQGPVMDACEAKANARITLGLDIIGRTDDGYHHVDSVKQKITLFDIVRVKA